MIRDDEYYLNFMLDKYLSFLLKICLKNYFFNNKMNKDYTYIIKYLYICRYTCVHIHKVHMDLPSKIHQKLSSKLTRIRFLFVVNLI